MKSLRAPELRPRQVAILAALRAIPGVVSATLSDREPASNNVNDTTVNRAGLIGRPPSLLQEIVGDDYVSTYHIRLVAGRWFDAAHRTDDMAGMMNTSGGNFSTVINRSAVPVLGFADPQDALGKTVTINEAKHIRLTIIGVVADVRFTSPRQPMVPQLYLHDTHAIDDGEAALRYASVLRSEMLARLQTVWHRVAPDDPFMASTADQRLADFYRPDQQRARLFSAAAILAVLIACTGLYRLASFGTARRLKEIGIRKVLGASTRDVLGLLVGQFVRPVLIANVIAWPIAWVAMRAWLSGFDQRIALSPFYFLVAGAAGLLIAVLTVLGQAWRVARAEPARALRYE